VEVGAADPAGDDTDRDLPVPRLRLWKLLEPQRLTLRVQDHGPHQANRCEIATLASLTRDGV